MGGDGYRERMRAPAFTFRPATGVTQPTHSRVPGGALYSLHLSRDGRLRVTAAIRLGGAGYRSRSDVLFPEDSSPVRSLTAPTGVAWRLAAPLALHAAYAQGFRAPSLTDLGTIGLQGNGFFEAS
jgi:hemoglobin/transferrin/lactoferrin receptor protein